MRVAHRTPGRVRLEAGYVQGEAEAGRRFAEAAATVEGVSKVEVRTATGSVIIFHTGEWEAVAERLTAAVGVAIEELAAAAGFAGAGALEAAADFVDAIDQGARRALGGRTDLSELAFLGLLVAGTVQLGRGRFVGPATALFGQALALMAARRSGARGRF